MMQVISWNKDRDGIMLLSDGKIILHNRKQKWFNIRDDLRNMQIIQSKKYVIIWRE